MGKGKLKRILKLVIPFIAFGLIFGLACGRSPEEVIESTEREIHKEIKEETVGVEEAKVTVENIKAIGRFIPLGESVEYDGLKVSAIDCIAMDSYDRGEGELEYPGEGDKFIWIYVKAENVGKQEKYLPKTNDFYILYIDSLISEGWSRENPYPIGVVRIYDPDIVMPGVSREGWILYETPKDVKAEDFLVALECDHYEYYYWEVPEPLKEVSPEPKAKEEAEAKEEYLTLGQDIEYEGIKTSVIK